MVRNMRKRRDRLSAPTWTGLAIVLALAAGAAHAAAEPTPLDIGRSILVVNDVDGQYGAQPPKRLVINDDVVFDEDIITSGASKTIIEFRDGSVFEVGPDAVVRINAFVFNPQENTSQKTLQVTRGVFRYVSGYIAAEQDTRIAMPSGIVGIRGSVAAGIVDPQSPDFIFVGHGSSVYFNDAGTTQLQQGQAIAVGSRTTVPMSPEQMPAPVTAQALQVIAPRLPPSDVLRTRPAADDALLRRWGTTDLLPVPAQAQPQTASNRQQSVAPAVSLSGDLGLLRDGAALHLFENATGAPSADQQAFIARANQEIPDAAAIIAAAVAEATALENDSAQAATAEVMRGITLAATTVGVLRQVVVAGMQANPAAAETITQAIVEAYPPDQREQARQVFARATIFPVWPPPVREPRPPVFYPGRPALPEPGRRPPVVEHPPPGTWEPPYRGGEPPYRGAQPPYRGAQPPYRGGEPPYRGGEPGGGWPGPNRGTGWGVPPHGGGTVPGWGVPPRGGGTVPGWGVPPRGGGTVPGWGVPPHGGGTVPGWGVPPHGGGAPSGGGTYRGGGPYPGGGSYNR
jgi:hypothetical protein